MKEYLSPTEINNYEQCQRRFYYSFIEEIKTPPTEEMLLGSAAHKVLERFFKEVKLPNKYWQTPMWKKFYDICFTTDKERRDEVADLCERYIKKIEQQIIDLLEDEKADCPQMALNFVKPKFSELKLTNEKYKMVGYADEVLHDKFKNRIGIIDYKTSKQSKHESHTDKKRQLMFYAYMYPENVDFVANEFLRTGDRYIYEVTIDELKKAEDTVKKVRNKVTETQNIEDYPCNKQTSKNGLCKWRNGQCGYYEKCFPEVKDG